MPKNVFNNNEDYIPKEEVLSHYTHEMENLWSTFINILRQYFSINSINLGVAKMADEKIEKTGNVNNDMQVMMQSMMNHMMVPVQEANRRHIETIADLYEKIAEHEEKINNQGTKIKNQGTKIKNLEDENKLLRDINQQLIEKVSMLESRIDRKNKKISKLKEELAKKDKEREDNQDNSQEADCLTGIINLFKPIFKAPVQNNASKNLQKTEERSQIEDTSDSDDDIKPKKTFDSDSDDRGFMPNPTF